MNLEKLKGVGPKTAKRLEDIGVKSIQDVLFRLPYRYQDRTRILPIADVRPGDQAVIEGVVISVKVIFSRKRQLQVVIEDKTAPILLTFFYFNRAQQASFSVGKTVRCFGDIRLSRRQLMIIHPEYKIHDGADLNVSETLTPIYPSADGLQQSMWHNLSEQALRHLNHKNGLIDILPDTIKTKYALTDIKQALDFVHRPPPDTQQQLLLDGIHPMQQRLAFEELLAHQVSLRELRQKVKVNKAKQCNKNQTFSSLQKKFCQSLGFQLTAAQKNALKELGEDLSASHPMMRLLQGDVGSGKTVVAALAGLQVIANNSQVALMAPTELLAEQHYRCFKTWFEPLGLQVAWLSGKLKIAEKRKMTSLIASGEANIVIGTHALFQKAVEFKQLGFIVIDEQHRFGVQQRALLREKGMQSDLFPHQLIMTATPIPRTLAMTVYADLDTSVLDELPPGRMLIKTIVVNNTRRDEVIERAKKLCNDGGQVYWVCPLIDESEVLSCEAAENISDMLTKTCKELTVQLVHGRMKSDEKQRIMQQFSAGDIDLLVATTVIEVGINVPNATLMIVENAERMGLAQLHQLRGRVGRGAKESYCVLLFKHPLTESAQQRLQAVRDSSDGFYLAEQDLKLRGPGEVMGTKQTGMQRLKIANIIRDREILPKVQSAAKEILQRHPSVIAPLKSRWLGDNEEYREV